MSTVVCACAPRFPRQSTTPTLPSRKSKTPGFNTPTAGFPDLRPPDLRPPDPDPRTPTPCPSPLLRRPAPAPPRPPARPRMRVRRTMLARPAADLPTATGILELANKSDGRLRQLTDTYVTDPADPVVASHLIERYDLRPGMEITVSLGKNRRRRGRQQRPGRRRRRLLQRKKEAETPQGQRHRPRRPAGQGRADHRGCPGGRVRRTPLLRRPHHRHARAPAHA